MELPKNRFKAALKEGRHQLGIWNSISGSTVPEAMAAIGFDWVLIDTEHAMTEAHQVQPALQAIAGYPEVSAIVRPVSNDPAYIKRYLDMGAQTLMIPYVQNVEEARAAVTAMRYPPNGMRGMAGAVRAGRFGLIPDYLKRAEEELCLIVQVETIQAMEQLEEIASVDGVDGASGRPGPSGGHRGDRGCLHPAQGHWRAVGHPDAERGFRPPPDGTGGRVHGGGAGSDLDDAGCARVEGAVLGRVSEGLRRLARPCRAIFGGADRGGRHRAGCEVCRC